MHLKDHAKMDMFREMILLLFNTNVQMLTIQKLQARVLFITAQNLRLTENKHLQDI